MKKRHKYKPFKLQKLGSVSNLGKTEGGHLVISLCMFSPSFCDMIPHYAHIFRYLQNK